LSHNCAVNEVVFDRMSSTARPTNVDNTVSHAWRKAVKSSNFYTSVGVREFQNAV